MDSIQNNAGKHFWCISGEFSDRFLFDYRTNDYQTIEEVMMTQDPFYEPDSSSYYATPPAAPPQKKNNTAIYIIVGIVLLLLCCCCAATLWFLWNYGDQIMYELGLNVMSALIN